MISRSWHGAVPIKHAEGFHQYLINTGIKEAKALPGNLGAYIYRQTQNDFEHFFMISYWKDVNAIIQFAGENPHIAVTYPEDDLFGLISDPIVLHQEILSMPNEFPLKFK